MAKIVSIVLDSRTKGKVRSAETEVEYACEGCVFLDIAACPDFLCIPANIIFKKMEEDDDNSNNSNKEREGNKG